MITPFVAPMLVPAFPLIFMGVMSLMLVVLGVSRKEEDFRTVNNFSIFTLVAVSVVVWRLMGQQGDVFHGLMVADTFGAILQMMVLLGGAVSLVMAVSYVERERGLRVEYPLLVLFSVLGMMVMVSANDLITLYVGLELQSLPLYVLAAIQRDTLRSTEAGLKYFILGALSSGMLLYGASLVYGFTGSTNFNDIATVVASQEMISAPGLVVGIVFLLAGLAFKVAAAPFHMWSPDVYEGAPTSVTAFFALAPKVAAMGVLLRLLLGPFEPMLDDWRQVIIALSIASMMVGSIGAIAQNNIKRLLAYSGIGHVGFALLGLAAASGEGIRAVVLYLIIYMVMTAGAFAVVLMMKRQGRMVEQISDLSGLASKQKLLAAAMAITMLSMAGIPPLAGFFSKLFIFQSVIAAQLYTLAIVGVLASVISAFYYLRVIKVMYFDEAPEHGLDKCEDTSLKLILAISSLISLLFIIQPAPAMNWAAMAAASLMP